LNRGFRLHGVAIVVLPAVPIDAATVVDPVASVVAVAMVAELVVVLVVVVGSEVAVIAVRLTPVQPVPSVGPSAIAHLVIAHSVIVHQAIVPSRTVLHRVVVLLRDVLQVAGLSEIDLLAIDPSGTERPRRATVVRVSSLGTVPLGQMLAGHSPVLPVRNAALNHPARTSFGGLGLPSLAQ
jgi:hypothetical protein